MAKRQAFFNIYEQLSGWRIGAIVLLLVMGAGILYYFNILGKSLEDREKKYARLYAESIKFSIEQNINSTCDYTFMQEMLEANETVPMILVLNGKPTSTYQNIPELDDKKRKWTEAEKENFKYSAIAAMLQEHPPIEFKIGKDTGYVYYSNSLIVTQLRYFPYILIITFLVFGSLAFIAYSSSRRAEQNRVWVGLAKETAHQLGTPISALMAWVEVLRSDENFDQSIGDEMEKDVKRLETITTRFSNIGSVPQMHPEHIGELVEHTLKYLQRRISTKVKVYFENTAENNQNIMLNKHLFEWVIENLCKNAVDAMSGVGEIHVKVFSLNSNRIGIDIRDTGKGISKMNFRKVFRPGFSTKKRGWGLGLTLAKRIVETYHGGQLFIKSSELGQGTTFRIILKA